MSVSTGEIGQTWRGLRILASAPIADIPSLAQIDVNTSEQASFLSRLEIPGLLVFPEQVFTRRYIGGQVYIENQPTDSWPQIQIECSSNLSIKDFALRLADDTVDGWLLHTRVSFSLAKAGEFSILLTDLPHKAQSRFEIELDKTFFQLARLSRKLKFIENTFNVNFSLPDIFSSEELRKVEIVFRGITEGEFSMRAPDFTFPSVSPSEIDLTKPPFDGCGSFSREIDNQITLFDKPLPVGSVAVHLSKAVLASLKVVQHIRKGSTQPVDVRFEVLDNQITYRFESYARWPRSQRAARLQRFKDELAREEPQELVDLIDETMQNDVSADEASQIAMGWTQYHDLPDRYCPQEPELDIAAGQWRVPIWLVYTSGEGGPVGEVVIDVKTGIIVSHTPIEELRSKGRTLAEQILHAG